MKSLTLATAAALTLLFSASPSAAATITWDGGAGNLNWNSAANWDTNVVPPNLSTVQFNGGIAANSTVALNVTTSVYANLTSNVLTLKNGAGFTIDFSAASAGSYNYFPIINVQDANAYTIKSNNGMARSYAFYTDPVFNVATGGKLSFTGNFVVQAYTSAAITKTGGGELDLATGITYYEGGSVNKLDAQGGVVRLAVKPSTTWNFANGLLSSNGADIYLSGSSSVVNLAGAAVTLTGNKVYLSGVTLKDTTTTNWTGSLADFDIASNAKMDIAGNHAVQNPRVDALTGSGQIVNTVNNGMATFTVGVNGGSGDFSGIIRGNGTTGDSAGVTAVRKIGDGTQIFSGASHYSGTTSIEGGALLLNGTQIGGGAYTVASGATLGGTGSTTSAVTVASGGFLAPGASTESLATGALNLQAGSTLLIEINGANAGAPVNGYDQVLVTGAVTLGGGNLQLTAGPGLVLNSLYTILVNDGADAISGTFAGLANHSYFTQSGYIWQINYGGGTGNDIVLRLDQFVVPEPSSALLIVLGIGVAALGSLRAGRRVNAVRRGRSNV